MTGLGTTYPSAVLRARLLPLHVAVALQGMMLWAPVEKLFMKQIGFTAASVGLMAAAYAAVTPILEVPSGILADRWSRRGVLILSAVALSASSLVGGLSNSVALYIVSAMILGVYFAMYSGTVESIVYDVVLEETGASDLYQVRIGRVRLVESAALVVSSLAGGWLAGLFGPRLTYFLTVPFAALAILAYLRFQEPRLHKVGDRVALREHIAVTYRTITRRGPVLPIVVLGALTALILQVIFEFGPLWLVALAAPAVLFGPYWAGLVSTLGIGGLLAGRIQLGRPATVRVVVTLMVLASVVLNVSSVVAAVVIAQIVLALLLVTASIHVSALLHDTVPSSIRAGVASGVSTISWVGFLPFALVFGWATRQYGEHASGWMITAATVVVAVGLIRMSRRQCGPSTGGEGPALERIPEVLCQ
ncbi:MAG: MFS transporter [Pseudonocardiales bacterium]